MHYVMVNVDLLDGNVGERDAKEKSARPLMLREACQSGTVPNDHQDLRHENCRKHIPHVDHLTAPKCKQLRKGRACSGVILVNRKAKFCGMGSGLFAVGKSRLVFKLRLALSFSTFNILSWLAATPAALGHPLPEGHSSGRQSHGRAHTSSSTPPSTHPLHRRWMPWSGPSSPYREAARL